jgi:hypothetical protein
MLYIMYLGWTGSGKIRATVALCPCAKLISEKPTWSSHVSQALVSGSLASKEGNGAMQLK